MYALPFPVQTHNQNQCEQVPQFLYEQECLTCDDLQYPRYDRLREIKQRLGWKRYSPQTVSPEPYDPESYDMKQQTYLYC